MGHIRIFFATDVHGSETCFRKWVNAAGVYGVQILILGGDITGKLLVPLVQNGDHVWRGNLRGEPVEARNESELDWLRERVATRGYYPILMSSDERTAIEQDPAELEARFLTAARERLASWLELAHERLRSLQVHCYMMLGNDDFPELAETLRGSSLVKYAEDGIFELPGGFDLVSFGYSTPTPWNTPREISEEEMVLGLEALATQVKDHSRAIFNIHNPPKGTHLDLAPKLDHDLRPIAGLAGAEVEHVGSTAVREIIERHEPLLGIHGHIHESPGAQKLGRTLCLNPGSDYVDGVLRGAIISLDAKKGVRSWQIVQG